MDLFGLCLNDSWRVHRRLTVNLGARLDRYRVFLPGQAHPAGRFNPTPQTFAAVDDVIAGNVLVPRVGAAFDLGGGGGTVAKVSYGRYANGSGQRRRLQRQPERQPMVAAL